MATIRVADSGGTYTLVTGQGFDGNYFHVTSYAINNPTPEMLANVDAVYVLNIPPYTQYVSNGSSVVSISQAAGVPQSATDGKIFSQILASYSANAPSKSLPTADIPSFIGEQISSLDPTTDPTDPCGTAVIMTGDSAELTWTAQSLTSAQKTSALRWYSGINTGLRFNWSYWGFTAANSAATDLGNAGGGNQGNNYDATLNPTVAGALMWADYLVRSIINNYITGAVI